MLANIFLKTIRDRTIGVAIGTVAVAAMFFFGMAVYQTIDVGFYYQLPEAYLALIGLPEGGDVGGLAYGALYNSIGAITLAALAISMGASSIAGEEANGTMGLLLGNPKSRSAVLFSKAGSILVLSVLAVGFLWLAGYLVPLALDVNITGYEVNALLFHMVFNTLFYGFLALAIGAWTGRGTTASGASIAVMVVGWVAVGILPLIESVEWMTRLFPWYYYAGSEPITNGVHWGHIAVLAVATAALAAAAGVGVNRRDLRSKSVKRTLIDRLRDNRVTSRVAERVAGTARVSSVFAKTASDHQGVLIATGAIMFYMGLLIGVFWRFLPEDIFAALEQFPDAILAMIGGANMATPAGWYQAEIFSLVAPIAMFALTVAVGARALAGEEERRTMDLLMASPVTRSRIILEKAGAMVVLALVLGVVSFAGSWLGSLAGGMGLGWVELAATCLLLTLIGLVMGAFALAVSALTGRARLAVYSAVGVALASYFTWSFLPLSDQYAEWSRFSPFHFYLGSDPLVNGMDWGHALILFGLFLGLVAISVPLFQRRDLRG